jgi:hypothetical protein
MAGAPAVSAGGILLIASPFLDWLGVRTAGITYSYTLLSSLRAMGRQDLLGPGMSVVPVVLAGSLAVIVGLGGFTFPSRPLAVTAVLLGAAAGAFAAYLHAALEYAGFAIAGAESIRVQTVPGLGLFLAIAGSGAILAGGILSLAATQASR